MSLVVDTGVLVAAARTSDPDHTACAQLLREATESRVVPAPVLVEVECFLRATPAWAQLMRDVLVGALVVAELDMGAYTRIDELLNTYADMRVGFVDCAVLAVVAQQLRRTLKLPVQNARADPPAPVVGVHLAEQQRPLKTLP